MELTEAIVRAELCEHDDDTEIVISSCDNAELYNTICDYLDVIKTGSIDRMRKEYLFRRGNDSFFYFYYDKIWEIVCDMNVVGRLMSELSMQNDIYKVELKNFNGVSIW